MDIKIYISQLSTSLFFYNLLFDVKKIDVRLNKMLKLKFIMMFFDRVYSTRPSDTATRYKIYSKLFKCYSVSFCYLILWLAKPDSKIISLLLFARFRFYKSSFFIPSYQHQDSNSYYLVVAAAKIPKILNVNPSTLFFDIQISRSCH